MIMKEIKIGNLCENHKILNWNLDNNINYVTGPNGYGKTTLFNTIYYLYLAALFPDRELIFMMDTPESSLHILWQRVLIKYMRMINTKAQLIIMTHSPEIIGSKYDKTFDLYEQAQ